MDDVPRMPQPDDVSAWLMSEARRLHSRVVAIACRRRSEARIWQAVLQETHVPLPGLIVRLVAPRHDWLTLRQSMALSLEDMAYDDIIVEVQYG